MRLSLRFGGRCLWSGRCRARRIVLPLAAVGSVSLVMPAPEGVGATPWASVPAGVPVAPGPRLAVPARARHDPEDELQDHEDDDDADDERERRETAVTPATLEHDP